MACTHKSELLKITNKEYAKLSKLIAPLDGQLAAMALDGVSIKDVIGHRAHWIGLFLGWYHDGLAGKEVFFPAEGYKWTELNRYNADLRQRQAHLDWEAVCGLLQGGYADMIGFIETASDETLYGGSMIGAKNDWTPGRWAEAAGASHFRSAAKFVRSVLKDHHASSPP
ncbi:ClbS/DfsB family four-helix bundle protein [Roseobacter sp. YSTF-M11]|uniref:ClbS/DfsB family four-helix bundle protein n=1 Tax=Roseobacter insulae TaxID=2859783 RepID=A0A9X1FS03_9RHOB|nr:ClbS/DfsB family four-helix bundle protein [Roseobacter insulae]MBW4706309.1 ClbS/DfsB family four-helix bundle protein [Roseobacter insulae]